MKITLLKVVAAVKAAVTSPSAVAQEKNLAVFVGTRVLLAVGASAGTIGLVEAIIKSLGN